MNYITSAPNDHERDEEMQWARILDQGNATDGVLLVFAQKLCTAIHEIEPACRAGLHSDDHVPFLRARISSRLKKVVTIMADNNIQLPRTADALKQLKQHLDNATKVSDLEELAEEVHQFSHLLVDEMEAR